MRVRERGRGSRGAAGQANQRGHGERNVRQPAVEAIGGGATSREERKEAIQNKNGAAQGSSGTE